MGFQFNELFEQTKKIANPNLTHVVSPISSTIPSRHHFYGWSPSPVGWLQVPSGQNLSAERIGALWRDADRGGEGELNLEAPLGSMAISGT
jgi:hypothetical protein